jgi:hypothetical protein
MPQVLCGAVPDALVLAEEIHRLFPTNARIASSAASSSK